MWGAFLQFALVIIALLTAAAYLVLLERWIAAWVQMRRGPNRVGIPLTRWRLFGLGQPLADGIKFLTKEEYTPGHVDRALYVAAPLTILTAALGIFAVIPFGSVNAQGVAEHGGGRPVPMLIAPGMDVGLLFVFALNGIAVYGVILAGWASNNKYSFLGGLRSSAQLIAYEIPLSLGILGVILSSGSLRLDEIISQQARSGLWHVLAQPLGFSVFMVAAFAEAARLPFDLPECEQELVGGYHTEYAGVKLLMLLVGEFLHMVSAAFLIVILFLGGWHLWGLTGSDPLVTWPVAALRTTVLLAKVLAVILFFMLVRWSWPRFRFDQLMDLAWKVMIPLGVLNLVAVATLGEYGGRLAEGIAWSPVSVWIVGGWFVALVGWVCAALWQPSGADNRPRIPARELLR